MACEYVFLENARQELAEACAYLTAATGGMSASDDLLANVERTINRICEFPTLHAVSRMPELAEAGYRVALVGSYALLYTFGDGTVFIEHVFHQRQDYAHLV